MWWLIFSGYINDVFGTLDKGDWHWRISNLIASLYFSVSSEDSNQKLSVEKTQLSYTVNELKSEMAAVHAKESELLDYIEKMTAKCTQLQSTLSVIQAQVRIQSTLMIYRQYTKMFIIYSFNFVREHAT